VIRAELVLCEALFRPGTVHSVKEVLANNCQNIKDSATPAMLVPGSTILHEFFHWRQMLATTGGTLVKDFNMAGNQNIDPPDGYGAYNAKVRPSHSPTRTWKVPKRRAQVEGWVKGVLIEPSEKSSDYSDFACMPEGALLIVPRKLMIYTAWGI
jgi:hypothetical protein